jgi:heme exporter protein B
MLKALRFIFYAEMILLLRRSQEWLYPLAFFLIVISLFPLTLTPDPLFLQKFIPGCIWIAALFASLLSMENIFFADKEDGHLEQLLLGEIPLMAILFAKLCAQWLITLFPLILLTPFIGILFHLSAQVSALLFLSLLLGTPILTLMECLCVALTLGLRQQGVLLGLLLLPLITPVLIFGINIITQYQAGLSIKGPLTFLAGLCVLAITLLPPTIAMTLRITLDD